MAIKYSGVEQGEVLPMVLEVRTGAVDRGASVRDFSQYVDEVRRDARARARAPTPTHIHTAPMRPRREGGGAQGRLLAQVQAPPPQPPHPPAPPSPFPRIQTSDLIALPPPRPAPSTQAGPERRLILQLSTLIRVKTLLRVNPT